MGRNRMFESDEGASGPASPRTTIVGGRPPEVSGGLPPVPIGLERLLRLAAADPGFGEKLIARRVAAAEAAGVELTRSEAAILAAIPAAQLEAMIAKVPPPAPPRREFLQKAAASAVVALGGAALVSCEACVRRDEPVLVTGIAPDMPPPRPNEVPVPQGIQPDVPPPKPPDVPAEHPRPDYPPPPTGITPDIPPQRPEYNPMQSEGGAAPHVPPKRPDANPMLTGGGHAPDDEL